MIQKGDTHYHCFGCSAHGDALQFLMSYLKMGFTDAVEALAEKFHVPLERMESKEEATGPGRKAMKQALDAAARFFHFYLIHTPEGHAAVHYLLKRGIGLDFIKQYRVGLAPNVAGMLRKVLHEHSVTDDAMVAAGLLLPKSSSSGFRDFFIDRITFPIHDSSGSVIGFSARKYKESTMGGKYVNTPETPLFKKSRILFGLHHCRRRIAKERKAIIVEGQIDALRLIHAGLNMTVAGQGTAFGDGHVQELVHLGVNQVFLALDSDEAGMRAAAKIGHLFQKEGVEVYVVQLPQGSDPDAFVKDNGVQAFSALLERATLYMEFLVKFYSREINISTPAGKNDLVHLLVQQIREWKHSVMVHESLRKLANLLQVPEHVLEVAGHEYQPNLFIRTSGSVGTVNVDPVRILESDFLRWLLLLGGRDPKYIAMAKANLLPDDLRTPEFRRIYSAYLSSAQSSAGGDLLGLIQEPEDQGAISELLEKKIDLNKGSSHFPETIQRILDLSWMEKREEIKRRIQSGQCDDDVAIQLLKEFETLKRRIVVTS